MTPLGLEPRISRSGGARLILWAMEPFRSLALFLSYSSPFTSFYLLLPPFISFYPPSPLDCPHFTLTSYLNTSFSFLTSRHFTSSLLFSPHCVVFRLFIFFHPILHILFIYYLFIYLFIYYLFIYLLSIYYYFLFLISFFIVTSFLFLIYSLFICSFMLLLAS